MDHVIEFMNEHDIPVTRENYLDVAYLGTPPEQLGAEEETALPEQLQKPIEPEKEDNHDELGK